jgi:hypothetical protein
VNSTTNEVAPIGFAATVCPILGQAGARASLSRRHLGSKAAIDCSWVFVEGIATPEFIIGRQLAQRRDRWRSCPWLPSRGLGRSAKGNADAEGKDAENGSHLRAQEPPRRSLRAFWQTA